MGSTHKPERVKVKRANRRADARAKRAKKASALPEAKAPLAAELERVADPLRDALVVGGQPTETQLAREKVRRWDARQQGWLYTLPLTHDIVARREATETFLVLDRPALEKEVLDYEPAPC